MYKIKLCLQDLQIIIEEMLEISGDEWTLYESNGSAYVNGVLTFLLFSQIRSSNSGKYRQP
jgi:transcription termination factor NusB